MLERLFNVIVAIFATPKTIAKNEGEVVHWTHYNDDTEDFNFGPDRDELIARFILEMWEKHHVCLTKAEVEQMLDEMDANDDGYVTADPHPVYLHRTRNDRVVVGHTMRPQTASLATTAYSRQKVC